MESIYNLVPKPQVEIVKTEMYRSKYDPNAYVTYSTFGSHGTHATVWKGINEAQNKMSCSLGSTSFGPAHKIQVCPSNYLKKHSRTEPKLGGSNVSKFVRKLYHEKKPSAPSRFDLPIMGLKTDKCFITSNALEAITMKLQRSTDPNQGEFMKFDGYGKVPSYLTKAKEDILREQKIVDEYIKLDNESASRNSEPEYVAMDENERQNLIIGLKMKWDMVNAVYQKMSHQISLEFGERKRREAQEAELEQLEKDITMLTRPGPIFVQKT